MLDARLLMQSAGSLTSRVAWGVRKEKSTSGKTTRGSSAKEETTQGRLRYAARERSRAGIGFIRILKACTKQSAMAGHMTYCCDNFKAFAPILAFLP